jgi:hypothetical protein
MIRKQFPALYAGKSGVNKKDVLQQSKAHGKLHNMAWVCSTKQYK